MWELDHKESWGPKNWCFWTVVLKKTVENPLDCKELKPVNPEGNQSWIFIGRTDVKAEAPIPWPPDVKNWLFSKNPDAGKDWRQAKKGTIEDEMVGWHQWTWVWASSPGVLQSMRSQRVGYEWATELLIHDCSRYSFQYWHPSNPTYHTTPTVTPCYRFSQPPELFLHRLFCNHVFRWF